MDISEMMSRIRGKDTQPERLVRRYLHAQGFRFRVCDSRLPGSPDLVLPKYRAVVFVHGCFWHGHQQCAAGKHLPKRNQGFWAHKIRMNRLRDKIHQADLQRMGWHVIVVWECALKKDASHTLQSLTAYLHALPVLRQRAHYPKKKYRLPSGGDSIFEEPFEVLYGEGEPEG